MALAERKPDVIVLQKEPIPQRIVDALKRFYDFVVPSTQKDVTGQTINVVRGVPNDQKIIDSRIRP